MRDYIPHREAELIIWVDNFIKGVSVYTDDLEIPEKELSAIKAAQAYFRSVAEDAKGGERTPVLTAKKDEAKADLVALVRGMVGFRLQNPKVSASMRVEMGLPPHDTVRTDHITVPETVDFGLHLRNIREILVDFRVSGSAGKAKPAHYDGAVIVWAVLDKPPAGIEDLNRHAMASRTPYALSFSEEERGRTVYITLAWQNERGNTGAWAEIQSAVVP